jgi:hypothetical protein
MILAGVTDGAGGTATTTWPRPGRPPAVMDVPKSHPWLAHRYIHATVPLTSRPGLAHFHATVPLTSRPAGPTSAGMTPGKWARHLGRLPPAAASGYAGWRARMRFMAVRVSTTSSF